MRGARTIPGVDPSYVVTAAGDVLSYIKPGRYGGSCDVLKPGKSSNGYLTVALRGRSHCVHRLVARAYIGETPADRWGHGTMNIGRRNGAFVDGRKSNYPEACW